MQIFNRNYSRANGCINFKVNVNGLLFWGRYPLIEKDDECYCACSIGEDFIDRDNPHYDYRVRMAGDLADDEVLITRKQIRKLALKGILPKNFMNKIAAKFIYDSRYRVDWDELKSELRSKAHTLKEGE